MKDTLDRPGAASSGVTEALPVPEPVDPPDADPPDPEPEPEPQPEVPIVQVEEEPTGPKRPPGKLYGRSLIDDLDARKAAMRGKQR